MIGCRLRLDVQVVCGDMEKHAYSVNDGIRDGGIRNLPMMDL